MSPNFDAEVEFIATFPYELGLTLLTHFYYGPYETPHAQNTLHISTDFCVNGAYLQVFM